MKLGRLRSGWGVGVAVAAVIACGCSDEAMGGVPSPGGASGAGTGVGAGAGGGVTSGSGGVPSVIPTGGASGAGSGGAGGTAGSEAGAAAAGTGGTSGDANDYAAAAASPLSTPVLVILVDFADNDMHDDLADPENDWAGLVFGTEQAQGNHYWYEVSNGTFQLLRAKESFGTADNGVIHTKLATPVPTSTERLLVQDQTWIPEALEQAAAFVDFASYDRDGDGRIQNTELSVLFPLHVTGEHVQGQPAEANIPIDHVFAASGLVLEKFTRSMWFHTSIGVNMHELAHHMFAFKHFPQPSEHCLMGTGAYGDDPDRNGLYDLISTGTRPTHLLGYFKRNAGFVEPTTIEATTTGVTLRSASTGEYDLVRLPLVSGSLYLEYRTAEGYDASVPFCGGHTGGLFATEVAERIVPFDLVGRTTWGQAQRYDTVLDQDFCNFYALPGYNDGAIVLGGYTIDNLVVEGSSVTFDVTKGPAPVLDHYKLKYAVTGPDGALNWRHEPIEPGVPLDVDFSSWAGGDDPTAYKTIELLAYYDTGELRSLNVDATYTSSEAYLTFSKSYADQDGEMLRVGIVAVEFEQSVPYVSTATVQVTAGTFSGTIRLLNLPSY